MSSRKSRALLAIYHPPTTLRGPSANKLVPMHPPRKASAPRATAAGRPPALSRPYSMPPASPQTPTPSLGVVGQGHLSKRAVSPASSSRRSGGLPAVSHQNSARTGSAAPKARRSNSASVPSPSNASSSTSPSPPPVFGRAVAALSGEHELDVDGNVVDSTPGRVSRAGGLHARSAASCAARSSRPAGRCPGSQD